MQPAILAFLLAVPLVAGCIERKLQIVDKIDRGLLSEAETDLRAALTAKDAEAWEACLWPTLFGLANAVAVSGNLEHAERLTESTLRILDRRYPRTSPLRFRPLNLQWALQYQQKSYSKARKTFQALRALEISDPKERAILHGTVAAQLQFEGLYADAEQAYAQALAAWDAAGSGLKAETIVLHTALATLYIKQSRFSEAVPALETALAIAASASDAGPRDRLNVLAARAALHSRQGNWPAAEADLRSALALTDGGTPVDPGLKRLLLQDFGYVLRKVKRKKEAQAAERLAASIPNPVAAFGLVDIREYEREGRKRKTGTVSAKPFRSPTPDAVR